MKTFDDLKFEPHPVGQGKMARLFFDNGYGISVVRFKIMGGFGSYTNNDHEWEVAVLYGNENEWDLSYDTHITDVVRGRLTSSEVTHVMEQIQELKP